MGMDKHCVNEISFTNNFCFFLNLPVNNELGIVQDGRHWLQLCMTEALSSNLDQCITPVQCQIFQWLIFNK